MEESRERQSTDLNELKKNADPTTLEQEHQEDKEITDLVTHDPSLDTEYLPESTPKRVFTPAHDTNTARTAQQAHNSLVVIGDLGHHFRIALAERHAERLKLLGHTQPFLKELNDGLQAKVIAAVTEAFEQSLEKKLICREIFSYSSIAMPHGIPIILELMSLNLPHIEKIVDHCSLPNETYDSSIAISPDAPDGATRDYFFSEKYLYQDQFVTMDDFLLNYPDQAKRIFDQVCSDIETLHNHGIYHRDLKGTNVIMSGDSPDTAEAIIIDLATCTKEKVSCDYCGTVGYMRPETEEGKGAPYSPQASDYFALSAMAEDILITLNQTQPDDHDTIAIFANYASQFKTKSNILQEKIQNPITELTPNSSLLVNQPNQPQENVSESNPSQSTLLKTDLVIQNQSLHEKRNELLADFSQQIGHTIGGLVVPSIEGTLDQQLYRPGINQRRLLSQQIEFIENYLAFIDIAAKCQAQGFRNDQQMKNYLRIMHQNFALNQEGFALSQMVIRSRDACDSLIRVTHALSAEKSPNQALHRAINRLKKMRGDGSATEKADLIEQAARLISVEERVRVNRNSAHFQQLISLLERP